MTTRIKKSLPMSITLLLGLVSVGARAEPIYNATVDGTSYNFTYFTGSYSDYTSRFSTTLMPWWGDSAKAQLFAAAIAGQLGLVSHGGPYFAYTFVLNTPYFNSSVTSYRYLDLPVITQSWPGPFANVRYVTATAVPEIDGVLIPQVGLLLAGLFIILGRRKENTEPMLAV